MSLLMMLAVFVMPLQSYTPAVDQVSTRRVYFGDQYGDTIKPADQAWCMGMPPNWPGCNKGY